MIPGTGTLLCRHDDDGNLVYERVLGLVSDQAYVVLIDCRASHAQPFFEATSRFEEAVREGRIHIPEADFFFPTWREEHLSEAQRKSRERGRRVLEKVFEGGMEVVFDPSRRGPLIRRVADEEDVSSNTVYRLLLLYFQRGMTWNALIPGFDRRGGKGVRQREGHAKRGKRSALEQADARHGVAVTGKTREAMTRALKTYHLGFGLPLTDTLQHLWEDSFSEGEEWLEGHPVPILKPLHERPTIHQLRYLKNVLRAEDSPGFLRARHGHRQYNMEIHPTLNRHKRLVDGPGHMYIGDGLQVPIHLRNVIDPSVRNTTPKVYAYVDAFDARWVGLYVTYENLSYHIGMLGLLCACSDKAPLLERLGIRDVWHGNYKPKCVFADNGELTKHDWEHLGNALDIDQVRAPPYRPDLKGLVEKAIDLLKRKLQSLPGMERGERKPGEPHPGLAGIFTLDEFTEMLVRAALFMNKHRTVAERFRDDDMRRDGVLPYPNDLYAWGLTNRPHHLRVVSPAELRLHMLPGGRAKVTRSGLLYKGRMFHSKRLQEEGYYDRAAARDLQKGNKGPAGYVDVAFHPWRVEDVSLRMKGQTALEPLQLLDAGFKAASFLDLEIWQGEDRLHQARRAHQKAQDQAGLNAAIARRMGVARDRLTIHKAGKSKRQLLLLQPDLQRLENELYRRRDSNLQQAVDDRDSSGSTLGAPHAPVPVGVRPERDRKPHFVEQERYIPQDEDISIYLKLGDEA